MIVRNSPLGKQSSIPPLSPGFFRATLDSQGQGEATCWATYFPTTGSKSQSGLSLHIPLNPDGLANKLLPKAGNMGPPVLVPMFAVTERPVELHVALLLLAVVLNSLAPENERRSTAAKVNAEDMEGRAANPCVSRWAMGGRGNSERFDRFGAWISHAV
jgi:hypothetical protein